jgi:cyclase
MEIEDRPSGYVGPNLDPSNLTFRPRRFGEGVYAIMANPVPRDNSGLIVGKDSALVIDAGINGEVAGKLQEMARRLTDKPLRYLVNTNYHGDHTFGNYAFPKSVEIIAHRETAAQMNDLDREKRIRARNLFGNDAAVADVTVWRQPDRLFDAHLEIDLGGRTVHLWNFGPGNTPGDTIVYEPVTQTAWTGNFVGNAKTLPMLLEAGPLPYLETVARFKSTLAPKRIVPGHGPLASPSAVSKLIRYLYALHEDVSRAIDAGLSELAAVEAVALREEFQLPRWFPSPLLRRLEQNFQRLNVLAAYRSILAERKACAVELRPTNAGT